MKDFLAHEVRNPLSVAISGLRFALQDVKGMRVVRDLHMVKESLSYIDELMSQMLDLNKFIAGKNLRRGGFVGGQPLYPLIDAGARCPILAPKYGRTDGLNIIPNIKTAQSLLAPMA